MMPAGHCVQSLDWLYTPDKEVCFQSPQLHRIMFQGGYPLCACYNQVSIKAKVDRGWEVSSYESKVVKIIVPSCTHRVELSLTAFSGLQSAKVGDVCCALYSEDQRWYRGRIVELIKSQKRVTQTLLTAPLK